MDLQAEKIELMKQLLDVESPAIINRLKSVFDNVDYDFYDSLPQQVKADIELALKEVEEGDVYDHEDVMREFKAEYGVKN